MASLIVLIAFAAWGFVGSQPEPATLGAPAPVATVRVTSAKPCALDDDVIRLAIEGEWVVINHGAEPFILMRGAPTLYYWRVAQDIESLLSRDWNSYSYYYSGDGWGNPPNLGAAPDERFVVVQAGQRHTERVRWSLLLVGSFNSSKWFAQAVASPSDDWDPVAEQATSKAWSSVGRLWVRGTRSQAFDIDVGAEPVPACETA